MVGLGPGDTDWMTPQSRRELAAATDLIGYGPYLDRVGPATVSAAIPATTPTSLPAPGWPARWPSRAAPSRWCPPAIPGVFAMATAVLEEAKQWPGVRGAGDPGDDGGAGRRQPGRRPAGPRLRGHLAVRPAQAVGGHRSSGSPPRRSADLVLAIYNPASKSRTWQVGAMRDLLLEHRDPGTPVVIGRDVSGPREEVKVVRLADLDPADVDMRCLLIVGSSQTQWYRRPGLHAAPLPDLGSDRSCRPFHAGRQM